VGLKGVADQGLALFQQRPQPFAQQRGRRLVKLALHRCLAPIEVGETSRLGEIAQPLDVAVGYLRATLGARLLEGKQVRQGPALLLQYGAQLVGKLAGGNRRFDVGEIGVDALVELGDMHQPGVQILKLIGDGVDLLGDGRVALGEQLQPRIQVDRGALRLFSLHAGLRRRLLALAVDQRVERLQPGCNPADACRLAVALGLQQPHPYRTSQKFLVEHLDLGTQRDVLRPQHPALCLEQGLAHTCLRGELELGGHRLALRRRLGQALIDGRRANVVEGQAGLEICLTRRHRTQLCLLLLKHALQLSKRRFQRQRQVGQRIRDILGRGRGEQFLGLGRGDLGGASILFHLGLVGAGDLDLAQGLAIELDEATPHLLAQICRRLCLGDPRFKHGRGQGRSGVNAVAFSGRTIEPRRPDDEKQQRCGNGDTTSAHVKTLQAGANQAEKTRRRGKSARPQGHAARYNRLVACVVSHVK
jgi:hypothetical protein